MSAFYTYPRQAYFGRVIPKNKIYEHSGASSRLKALFVEQVEQIVWAYKLAPETINLPARPDVPEIQIFSIQLKSTALHVDVLRSIDNAVQFPVLFELRQGQGDQAQTQVVGSYKRPSESNASKWVQSDYFETEWLPMNTTRKPIPVALDLSQLYNALLLSLMPHSARPQETLAQLVQRLETARMKRRELEKVQVKMDKEKQFNRKVEINANLRQLKSELEKLSR